MLKIVWEISDAQDFAENSEKHITQRELIKRLLILRKTQGISQQEIAAKLGCSQSRVSKLENSEDMRFGDLLRYMNAINLQPQFIISPNKVAKEDIFKLIVEKKS